jgi:hypothetical protein
VLSLFSASRANVATPSAQRLDERIIGQTSDHPIIKERLEQLEIFPGYGTCWGMSGLSVHQRRGSQT